MKWSIITGFLLLTVVAGCRRGADKGMDGAKAKSAKRGMTAVEANAELRAARENPPPGVKPVFEFKAAGPPKWAAGSNADDLAAARKAFTSNFIMKRPAPQEYTNDEPPTGVRQVEYPSGELRLKAWLSADAGDGKKHPAVVFLHGGWAFGGEDWTIGEPFVRAGFVLMMPMLRGENGNPGHHESFLGEVDDAVAAGRYVAALPYVDSANVFVVGHSVGGILTALVAMMPSPYKAAVAYDGYMEMKEFSEERSGSLPFDTNVAEEVSIRNPMDFAASVRCPLKLYATSDAYRVNSELATNAQKAGRECKVFKSKGDHLSMLDPAVQQTVKWFQELTGK